MPKVRTSLPCPNCRAPIAAEIEQVFDAAQDPSAKQRFLSGQFNIVTCPACGYHGTLASPLLYHDPAHDLLMSFVPPQLNLPRNEQERVIGGLIQQVVNALPQEQRRGYLFSPQAALTLQGMVERVLEKEGVTKEMLDAQKQRLSLLQRLAAISDEESLDVVLKEEDAHIDNDFFRLLTQLVETSLAQGDQRGAQALANLQNVLVEKTTFGKELKARADEIEAAVKSLRDAGQSLTREKLLELVLAAASDTQREAYAGLARGGMDYQFFQLLSEKIEAASGDQKARLEGIRAQLLEATRQVDEQTAARRAAAEKNLDILLLQNDIKAATLANLPAIDDFFIAALDAAYRAAEESKDNDRLTKLEQVVAALQEVSQAAAGPDGELLQSLLDAPDKAARLKLMQDNAAKIDDAFVEALTGVVMQLDGDSQNKELAEKARQVYREAVRFSMQAKMKSGG
ncbi:MAG: CpXC domain-containing protein [Chloroflexi bacterium]|nr:CpXC domain-containing protein [Chloroflexota bacterium]